MIEFPQTYSALLIGLPGVGKSEYCLHLAKGCLEKGERVAYVATEKRPSDIRKRMKELGVDLEAHEGESFLFIDVFTRSAGTREEKVLYVDNPSNLNLMSVRLSEASDALGKPVRIIFDSLSTFFLHAPEGEIRSFFESINAKINMDHSFVLFTLHEEMHDEKAVVALKAMVLSVLEMGIEDAPSRKRKFRVVFAKQGVSYSPDWFEFRITKEGLEFSPIKEAAAPGEKKAEEVEVKRKQPLLKVAVFAVLLLAVAVVAFQIGDYNSPRFERSPYFEGEERGVYMDTQIVTPAPAVTGGAPMDEPSTTTTPRETQTPPSISEFRLDGMEDINNWYPNEGDNAFVDIAESTEFSKVGKSIKVSVEILGGEDNHAQISLYDPDLVGYDGVTILSYVPEPLPLGRLEFVLEEEGDARYMYTRMRNLNNVGWIKDTIPFSGVRLSPWGHRDENGQLDLDRVKAISINFGGSPNSALGTYVFYLDELNLFKYQNESE